LFIILNYLQVLVFINKGNIYNLTSNDVLILNTGILTMIITMLLSVSCTKLVF